MERIQQHKNEKKHRIFKYRIYYKDQKRKEKMEKQIFVSLESYEKDFMDFQNELQEIRKSNPDQFVAFINGKVFASGKSVEEIKSELGKVGVDPSGTVIEFVSKDEIRMIV